MKSDLLGKTNFTFAFRFDHNSYFGDAFSPRIAIVNQATDQLTFKLQFGTAFRSPTNLEIYQTPSTSTFQLKKEKIRTYEVNAIYTPSKNLRAQINGFRNELTDVIVLGNLSGLNADKNPGVIKVNGVETILDMMVTKEISSFLNFTFQDPKGKNLITGIIQKNSGCSERQRKCGDDHARG